ncbi:hypothetical protein Goshw_019876 [Gossypium schwendimanii]|uniref:RNase H type-1 domain-containing protein n=1 Tax=Gossypium schwendimanii TaxID=34291 RepID=A0A7J9KY64_GOSSC|nr:hypothetical protein [Gossypium schwendimanii]
MWAIWTVRNKFIPEGEQKTGSQLVDLVYSYLKELDGLNNHLPGNGLLMGRQTAPTGSTVKINFDIAFNRQRKESCSKLVVRNEKAEVICSRTVMHENIPSIFAIEAMVCLQAIHLGLNLGLGMVEIEGDAHTMIRKLQAKEERRNYLITAGLEEGSKATLWIQVFSSFTARLVRCNGIEAQWNRGVME